jgi:hypothetical protein
MRTAFGETVRDRVLRNARQSILRSKLHEEVIRSLCEESPPCLLMMERLMLLETSVPYSTEEALKTSLEDLPKTREGLYSTMSVICLCGNVRCLGALRQPFDLCVVPRLQHVSLCREAEHRHYEAYVGTHPTILLRIYLQARGLHT